MIAAVGLVSVTALAQQPIPVQRSDKPALEGPKVSVAPVKPSLVENDFNGHLKRLEVPAEEAAVKLLSIDVATKAKVDTIVSERAAIMDKAVIENIDLIVQIHNAGQAGEKAEALRLLQEFGKKLEGLKARGKLKDEISDALPESQRQQFADLVKEYREAAVKDTMEQARAKGEEMDLRKAAGREVVLAIGQEIKRSYERQIGGRKEDFEKLLASLDLKPEQETKIRNFVTDYVQQTKYKPTPEQKRELFGKIYKELDEGQRKALLAYYREAK
jgi:hypothetical protein